MEQGASQVKKNNFEEEMHSAFWRGVTLLKELNSSGPDVGQHQGEPGAPTGPSNYAEGFSELPKNVMLLEGAVGKLTDKDLPKVASTKWRSTARVGIEWLQKHELRKVEKMHALLQHIGKEIDRVESLIEKEDMDV